MTTRKRWVLFGLGMFAISATGVALALGGKGFFFRHVYDGVKRELALSAEQSRKVDALRDRVMATMKHKGGDRAALIQEAKSLWLSDKIDGARLNALETKLRAKHAERHATLRATILELHGLLTPPQRQKLAALAERFVGKMTERWKHQRGPF